MTHNCPKYEKQTEINASFISPTILGKCCFCKKSVPDTELVLCDKCSANHCLTHRHYDSHQCVKNFNIKTKETVVRKLMTNTSAPNVRGTKNEVLARKVALMKLKQSASGQSSLPITERLYFKISYQKSSEQNLFENKDVFLSKEWSVGKCIDWLSSHLSIINNNNNPLAPKLVLCSDSETSDPFSMSPSLKQLESEGVVQSGDKLCLKYIQN